MLSPRFLICALAALTLLCACSSSPSASTPTAKPTATAVAVAPILTATLNDSCLVGTWSVLHEADNATIGKQTIALSGLTGATFSILSSGLATFNYDAAKPLMGTYNGRLLTETFAGTATYQLQTHAGVLSMASVSSQATVSATLAGVAQSSGSLTPAALSTPSYTCTQTRLDLQFPDPSTHTTFLRTA